MMSMQKGAQFSDCRTYRYALWRRWREDSHVMFIGLNPSTADETQDDPTIRRCIGFAKAWGFGGLYMLNLFAYRATSPKDLKKAANPTGPENDNYLSMYLHKEGLNIACWGNHGRYLNRAAEVISLLGESNLSVLGMTKMGQPKHPLYIKGSTQLEAMCLYYKPTRRLQ